MVVAELGVNPYDIAITSSGILFFGVSGGGIIQRLDNRDGNSTTVIDLSSTSILGLQVFDPLNQISGIL
jgi:streptogramin lyase